MAKGGKRTFGSKPKGKAKHKGAKGNASKRKTTTASKIKTKAKTANRGIKRRQQRVAKEKATAPVESPTMDNRELDEAAPASVSDEIEEPPTRFPAAA